MAKHFAHLTVIADSQASRLRSRYVRRAPVTKPRFWGLELTGASLPSYAFAYGVMGSGPPILIYRIGTNETRILIDIPNSLYQASSKTGGVKAYIRTKVIPTLPAPVQPLAEIALEEGILRSMPNPWLPPSMNRTAG